MNVIKGNTFSNCETGIAIRGNVSARIENNRFVNVERPFDINGASNIDVRGTRIENSPVFGSGNKSKVGYTGRNGPPLPAHCPNCQLVFPSRNYDINSNRFYGLDNEETCPECHFEHAKLADGIFDLTDKIAKIIEAEQLTYEMFSNVGKILETLLSNQINQDDALNQISAISPGIGSTIKGWIKSQTLTAWIGIFLSVLSTTFGYMALSNEAPTCVISQTIQERGGNVQYEIHLAAEQCLDRLKDLKISEHQEIQPDHSIEMNKINKQEQTKIKLPFNGPVPPQKPLK